MQFFKLFRASGSVLQSISVRKRHLYQLPLVGSTLFDPSLMEMGFLMKSLLHQGTTQVFCLLQLGGARVNPSDLRKCLKMLQMRHPLLRCRPQFIGGRFYLEHNWEIVIPIYISNSSWMETWRRIQSDVSPLWESTLQVWLIWDQEANRNDIFLSLSHAICDGVSAYMLIRELLQLLSAPLISSSLDILHASPQDLSVAQDLLSRDSHNMPSSWERDSKGRAQGVQYYELPQKCNDGQVRFYLPRSSASLAFSSLTFGLLFSSILPLIQSLWHASSLLAIRLSGSESVLSPNDLAQKNKTLVRVIEVDSETLSRLKRRGREFKASLTAAVTSAYVEALFANPYSQTKPTLFKRLRNKIFTQRANILWPVQLRPIYSKKCLKNELSMHTSFLTFSITASCVDRSAPDLWCVARQLSDRARKRLRKKIPLVFSYFAARATATPLSRSQRGHSVFFSLSSLGVLNAPQSLGDWSLKNFLILCQVASCKNPSVIMFTQAHQLTITMLASHPSIEEKWLDKFEESFRISIRKMAYDELSGFFSKG